LAVLDLRATVRTAPVDRDFAIMYDVHDETAGWKKVAS